MTKGGQRLATAVGGTIAGFRSEVTIIDDPMQPDEIESRIELRLQAPFLLGLRVRPQHRSGKFFHPAWCAPMASA